MQYNYKSQNFTVDLIDGENKNILFAVSGGADSTILLYIIAKLNRDLGRNHNIIPFTVPRPGGGADYSPAVVQWISAKLGVHIPAPMIVGDGTLKHNIVVKTAIKDLLATGKYDYLYVAENKIPPVDVGGLAPVRAASPVYARVALPFWGITKECIIDLYYTENIPELLKLTHSCTEMSAGRCNYCFQCGERAWAFDQLGRTDPGTE